MKGKRKILPLRSSVNEVSEALEKEVKNALSNGMVLEV